MGSRLKTARRTIFSTPFQALRAKEMPSTSADPPVRTRLRGPRLESCYRQSNFRRTGYARPLDAAGGPLLVFFCSGTAFFRRCLRQRAHRAFRASGDHDFGITLFPPLFPRMGKPFRLLRVSLPKHKAVGQSHTGGKQKRYPMRCMGYLFWLPVLGSNQRPCG